jgi:acetyl-CoA C-acetyltransferase
MSEEKAAELGLEPRARIVTAATYGNEPEYMGVAPIGAIKKVLDRAGMTIGDIDVVELNEAFAGQVLACCAELGLDPRRVCPQGGALGLGHPWGASGAVLLVRLFSQLVRARVGRGRTGLAAIAAGGGQGVAVVVEAVA